MCPFPHLQTGLLPFPLPSLGLPHLTGTPRPRFSNGREWWAGWGLTANQCKRSLKARGPSSPQEWFRKLPSGALGPDLRSGEQGWEELWGMRRVQVTWFPKRGRWSQEPEPTIVLPLYSQASPAWGLFKLEGIPSIWEEWGLVGFPVQESGQSHRILSFKAHFPIRLCCCCLEIPSNFWTRVLYIHLY